MSNVFGDYSAKLIQRIKQAVPALQFTGADSGQLEIFDATAGLQIALPCSLIDFRELIWEDLTDNTQRGEGFLQIRIGIDPAATDAATFHELQQKVHKALHGFTDAPFGKLLRRRSDTEQRENKYCVHVIRYALSVTDVTTAPEYTSIPRPVPVVNGDEAP
ncbi:hypothetical protein [Chitinophaga solisilvae]|uniref:hypothetical protein n=1 Tax=Chitinophaga solisilvae TaxID=1233460 RepID=UPI00136B21F1|nr:hypothetical protein [Chitinophaga solisilvae]